MRERQQPSPPSTAPASPQGADKGPSPRRKATAMTSPKKKNADRRSIAGALKHRHALLQTVELAESRALRAVAHRLAARRRRRWAVGLSLAGATSRCCVCSPGRQQREKNTPSGLGGPGRLALLEHEVVRGCARGPLMMAVVAADSTNLMHLSSSILCFFDLRSLALSIKLRLHGVYYL